MAKISSSIFKRSNLILLNLGILLFFLLLVAGIYFWVAKKSKGQLIFPAGLNYLAPKTAPQPTPLYDFAKLATSTDWATFKGKNYRFSFQYPKALTPLTFPNDPSEAVAFKVSDLPPQLSLLFVVETISARDKSLVGKPKEFVRGYWRFFTGLSGLDSITSIQNEKGLKGFKATYKVKAGGVTSEKYFFVIEGDDDHVLQLANIFPKEGDVLFKRIVNSLDYQK